MGLDSIARVTTNAVGNAMTTSLHLLAAICLASPVLTDRAIATNYIATDYIPTDHIVVIHDDSGFPQPPCPDCQRMDIAGPHTPDRRVEGVILSGHSTYGLYLGRHSQDLARLIAGLAPQLRFVVLDTCFGAQAELLLAFERAGVRVAAIVAVADWIAVDGIDYGDALLGPTVEPTRLLEGLTCCSGVRRSMTQLDAPGQFDLAALIADTRARARRCALSERLVHVLPNLYPVELAGRAPGASGRLLVHVPAEDWPERGAAPVAGAR